MRLHVHKGKSVRRARIARPLEPVLLPILWEHSCDVWQALGFRLCAISSRHWCRSSVQR
ncbi:protein of unknown function [Candidatus Filomicrobium marinum]|uniref:Uncharacterized protein n=1 Tax=Candidatus Filomicrobium marinum TaxID=1608628 RepID=A0A0D6JE07_9HYPH|nr:protein of unknown function [Candidatus Filomicrobium marinum]CPR17661.1 protein of unknown function [Candidatus Filomicrobium marinum]